MEHHLRQPNWPGIPPKGLSGTEATCPGSVSHQEGLRLFEEGSREEPGRILGRVVRDHGGSFPSTLTNLKRASRKKRPDLLRTPKGTGSSHRLTANKWLHQRSQLGRTLVSSQTHFACTQSDELCAGGDRSARVQGRLLYSPLRQLDYGFRLYYTLRHCSGSN